MTKQSIQQEPVKTAPDTAEPAKTEATQQRQQTVQPQQTAEPQAPEGDITQRVNQATKPDDGTPQSAGQDTFFDYKQIEQIEDPQAREWAPEWALTGC